MVALTFRKYLATSPPKHYESSKTKHLPLFIHASPMAPCKIKKKHTQIHKKTQTLFRCCPWHDMTSASCSLPQEFTACRSPGQDGCLLVPGVKPGLENFLVEPRREMPFCIVSVSKCRAQFLWLHRPCVQLGTKRSSAKQYAKTHRCLALHEGWHLLLEGRALYQMGLSYQRSVCQQGLRYPWQLSRFARSAHNIIWKSFQRGST